MLVQLFRRSDSTRDSEHAGAGLSAGIVEGPHQIALCLILQVPLCGEIISNLSFQVSLITEIEPPIKALLSFLSHALALCLTYIF